MILFDLASQPILVHAISGKDSTAAKRAIAGNRTIGNLKINVVKLISERSDDQNPAPCTKEPAPGAVVVVLLATVV